MKKSIFKVIIPLALAVLAVAGVATASHSWSGYHWARTSNPFTMKLGDNVSGAWDATLATASSDWSKSDVLDTTIVAGVSKGNCQPTKGRVEVCNKTYGNNGWLGVAQIWITDGTHITQGSVRLNDTYFNTPMYNTQAWRNLVTCQEVGHTFGLDHQDENFNNPPLGTCMDYTNDPTPNQHPNAHDYEELGIIYSHSDLFTTLLSGTTGRSRIGAEESASAAEFGNVLRRDSRGRPSLYGLDLGHGEKQFTFVYWAH